MNAPSMNDQAMNGAGTNDLVTLCVIDDIKSVVNGIAHRIPWREYGIEVVGTALDGEEGLALIRELRPHIVITDIRMPGLSGLDMAKLLGELGVDSKFVFISGYSDFGYAQEAVKLGAFDYLLKPFTQQQVVDAILKAREAVIGERARSDALERLERQLNESMPHLRQELCRRLLRYDSGLESLNRQWGFLQMEMDESPLVAMTAEIDGLEEKADRLSIKEIELGRFAVQNVLEETLGASTRYILLRENAYQFVAVFNPPAGMDTGELLERCRENVDKWTAYTVSIGYGAEADTLQSVYLSFEQARSALSYSFYSGGNCVLPFAERRSIGAPRLTDEREQELLSALRSGNREKAQRLLGAILEDCARLPVPPDPALMASLLYGLAFSMFRTLSEQVDDEERLELETRLAETKERSSLSLEGWRRALLQLVSRGCDMLENRRDGDTRRLVRQAQEFVEAHLQMSLTVNDCARSVHLSPSYFANVFKKETGLTPMQYITRQRMERAKRLLAEGYQVQEIASAVGYEDRPYFSELFKKHTGMTPSEFRGKK